MGSRIGDYVAILNEAENGDRPLVDVFIDLFAALDGRITSIEAVSQSVAVLQQKLLDQGNAIVSTTLDPLVTELKRKADLGLLLTATSVTEVEIGTGVKTFVVAPDEARASFAPSHVLSVVSTDSPSNAMYGRRVSYDPATGSLVVEILVTTGVGTISSWTISPGSIASMASTVTSAAVGEISATTVQAAIGQIVGALAARQPLNANLSALAGLVFTARRVLVTDADGHLELGQISDFAKGLLALGSSELIRDAIGSLPANSPYLGGAPTAPTASIATDSLEVVNVTALRQGLAAILDTAPEALNTLHELAAALGNDAAFSTTVMTLLGGKQPLDATLTALAAVVTAADKLVYATGVDTFATATLTAFARTLLDDADAATARATLAAAPLASPAFTGTPTVPTAAAGTNTTQAASTAFVATALANLIASSPAALDTLNELAAALGDDPNFAATMTTALAGKQPLDATLTALAAVVTAADKLVYATGVDTFATATLTAFARTLLDDTTADAMWATLGGARVQFDAVTATGTLAAPSWAQMAWIWAVGGGGGGGSGRRGAAATDRGGGGGGSAGTITFAQFLASELAASLSITIGAGGAGGAAKTTDSTNGSNGGTGGTTSIASGGATILTALGGYRGDAGAASVGTTGIGGAMPFGTFGVAMQYDGGTGYSYDTTFSPGSGGKSGDIDAANSTSGYPPTAGGIGYNQAAGWKSAGGTAGTNATGVAGGAGTAKAWSRGLGGGGGGGGCGNTGGTVAGGAGGVGGAPGGGGGGGGASTNGANSGAGGAGGRGEVWVLWIG